MAGLERGGSGIAIDSTMVDAATNLGVIEAQAGDLQDAIKLCQNAFQRAPARSSIGLNLVQVYCAKGKFVLARTYTLRVLDFNPDPPSAKKLLQSLNQSPANCGPRRLGRCRIDGPTSMDSRITQS